MPVKQRISLAAENGYDGIELIFTETGEISPERTDAELLEYRKYAESLGVTIPSIVGSVYGKTNLGNPDPAIIDAALSSVPIPLWSFRGVSIRKPKILPGAMISSTITP